MKIIARIVMTPKIEVRPMSDIATAIYRKKRITRYGETKTNIIELAACPKSARDRSACS